MSAKTLLRSSMRSTKEHLLEILSGELYDGMLKARGVGYGLGPAESVYTDLREAIDNSVCVFLMWTITEDATGPTTADVDKTIYILDA